MYFLMVWNWWFVEIPILFTTFYDLVEKQKEFSVDYVMWED